MELYRAFSKSSLWELQHQYFYEKGVEAWRSGDVPHYLTNNPRMANCYAEIIIACWQDQQSEALFADGDPLFICELGAGSGRFAFHFLKRLTVLCQKYGLSTNSFCYILTDFTPKNLEYWHHHPNFQPYFESGLLDMALFDANSTAHIDLQIRGKKIAPKSLTRPLVVIANYLFDSIPQELFYFEKGQCFQCNVLLNSKEYLQTYNEATLLDHIMHCSYKHEETQKPLFSEPYLQQLVNEYQQTLSGSYLLFPTNGLRCLQRLRLLSKCGVLFLTADKGNQLLEDVQTLEPPGPVVHGGAISLSVNFHAIKVFCENEGGLALFSPQQYHHINLGCLLFLEDPKSYLNTQYAYQHHVVEFGPDEFYNISKHARQNIAAMTVHNILAYLRLSFFDAHLFACYLPRLLEMAPEVNRHERLAVRDAIHKAWSLYFPIGEPSDLAFGLARLLLQLDFFEDALEYFEYSILLYGENSNTFENMAACYYLIGEEEQAQIYLQKAGQNSPEDRQDEAILGIEHPKITRNLTQTNRATITLDKTAVFSANPFLVLRPDGYQDH